MNKKKEDSTSAEASNKQKKKGRLDGMIDAMNKRSDPHTTHKVATQYFSSFRSERNIQKPQINKQILPVTTDTTVVDTARTTAVTTPVIENSKANISFEKNSLSATHTDSENKVYNAIKSELLNSGAEEIRVGITRLKELTGLSDKTIRVAIKSLEDKKSIVIIKPSQGVYGRLYFLPASSDVVKKRLEEGIQIDWVSKHIIPR